MPDLDAELLVDQVTMLGLVSREQLREAMADAEDGSPDAVLRMLLRKGWLTSWQIDRLKKGDPSGFFYGDSKVLFHLAEGTFARVYRGEHTGNGQAVAIKVLRQRFATIPDAVYRFHQEAEAGIRLRHENIVRIIDVGQQDNRHFMIMEYVEGMNLRDFLKLRVRIEVAPGRAADAGIGPGHEVFDWDTASPTAISRGRISSSPTAASPSSSISAWPPSRGKRTGRMSRASAPLITRRLERTCKSPKGDPRSDIYFLGCVFYQMLTGQLPMEESESKDMLKKMLVRSFGAIKPIGEHPYAPDEELAEIIEKMMKIDLKSRYQTMDEVVADLERYQASHDAATGKVASRPVAPTKTMGSTRSSSGRRSRPRRPRRPQPAPLPFEVKAVVQKSILCVEAQDEIQDVLRKTLTKMGYRVFVVRDAELAAERFRESAVDAVIFDTDGQGPDAIDALIDMHEKAHEDEHQLVALVLLGPRQGELKEKLPTDDKIIVLSKPLKMKEVQDSIHRLLPAQ